MSRSKVNKFILLMSILYGAFAMVDDSSWLEGSTLSYNYIDQGVNVEAQDDATPLLSLSIKQHRNFRTLAVESKSSHITYPIHASASGATNQWQQAPGREALPTSDRGSLICILRI